MATVRWHSQATWCGRRHRVDPGFAGVAAVWAGGCTRSMLMKPENSESKKYYFSSISQYFKNHLVVQKDSNGEYSDVLMLSIRNSHLKVLYGHLTNPQSTFSFLRQFIIQNRISTISIFHPELVLQMKKQFVFCLYKKPISKRFRISMDLWPFLKDYLKEIQCGDGDSCFTWGTNLLKYFRPRSVD